MTKSVLKPKRKKASPPPEKVIVKTETKPSMVVSADADNKKKKKKKKKKKSKNKSRQRKLSRAIKLEQSSKTTAIKRAAFARQVKLELSTYVDESGVPFRITPEAIAALQTAAEQHMVERLSDAHAIASRCGKLTPNDVDLRLVCSLKPLAMGRGA